MVPGETHKLSGQVEVAMHVSMSMSVSTPLFTQWLLVAFKQERDAWACRRAGEGGFGGELRESMAAITAATNSLEALYDQIADIVGATESDLVKWGRLPDEDGETDKSMSADARVMAVLRRGFTVRKCWARRMEELFQLRNRAVHPSERPAGPHIHPTRGVGTSWDRANFTPERATAAVDLVLEVMAALTEPKAGLPKLVAWLDGNRDVFANVLAQRSSERG
jgi:hypothetical protein